MSQCLTFSLNNLYQSLRHLISHIQQVLLLAPPFPPASNSHTLTLSPEILKVRKETETKIKQWLIISTPTYPLKSLHEKYGAIYLFPNTI